MMMLPLKIVGNSIKSNIKETGMSRYIKNEKTTLGVGKRLRRHVGVVLISIIYAQGLLESSFMLVEKLKDGNALEMRDE